jgi:beta-lysine 5,6-aminomutase alpha subunit
MPPTKYMTGDTLQGFAHNTMFNLVCKMTNQDIQLLGMLTEAVHTPFISDRSAALDSMAYINTVAKDIALVGFDSPIIDERIKQVEELCASLLTKVYQEGLFNSIADGDFADISRQMYGGRGYEGVMPKSANYVELF